MAMAPEQTGIGIRRHFTTEGVHPYDEVTWERRDARITNFRDGSVAFEQLELFFFVELFDRGRRDQRTRRHRIDLRGGPPPQLFVICEVGDQPAGRHVTTLCHH